MSYELTKWACDIDGIDIYERGVLQQLCKFANEDGICFPSQTTIADKLNISRVRVNQAIQKLKKLGLISFENGKFYRIIHNVSVNVVNTSVNVVNSPPVNVVNSPVNIVNTPVNVVNSHLNKPINKPINKSERDPKQENRFQEFWLKYPVSRREGLEKTKTAYRVVIEKITEPFLFKALEAQLAVWAKEKTEDKFKKYILRWLQDGAWQKFIEAPKSAQGQAGETYQELITRIDAGRASWTREHTLKYQITEARARSLINEKKCEAA